MIVHHTPETIRAPFSTYSHGVEVPPSARWLFCSGQLGIAPDETVPEDVGAQTERAFLNIGAILQAAHMDFGDIVRLNAYLTDPADLQAYMEVRNRFVTLPAPASTLIVVSAFARPEFKVEVEAVAARV